jgi:hypothetical protein
VNESILAPFSKQTESFHSPRLGRTLRSFPSVPWLGCFSLSCPDLAADRHPDSNTYKSHWYTSRQRQYRNSNRHVHSQLSYILHLHKHNWYSWSHIFKYHTGKLKGLLGPHSSVGHNYDLFQENKFHIRRAILHITQKPTVAKNASKYKKSLFLKSLKPYASSKTYYLLIGPEP